MLINAAKKNGIEGLTASVLPSNKEMLQVFKKGPYSITTALDSGVYNLTIPFTNSVKPGEGDPVNQGNGGLAQK